MQLVFIDDSGDPGFKVEKGSSPVFVIALVIFDDQLVAEETALAIKKLHRELKFSEKTEFKFHGSRLDVRRKFLETVAPFPFRIRSIVVKKEVIRSDFLKNSKESFFNYVVMQVIKHSQKSLSNAKLTIDKRGEKKIRDELRSYLSRQLNNGKTKVFSDLKFKDSKENVLLQLADMVASCIASYHKGKNPELYASIKKRIQSDWEFK